MILTAPLSIVLYVTGSALLCTGVARRIRDRFRRRPARLQPSGNYVEFSDGSLFGLERVESSPSTFISYASTGMNSEYEEEHPGLEWLTPSPPPISISASLPADANTVGGPDLSAYHAGHECDICEMCPAPAMIDLVKDANVPDSFVNVRDKCKKST